MKKNKKDAADQNISDSITEKPEIYAVRRKYEDGQHMSRRNFISLGLAVTAGAVAAGSLSSCSSEKESNKTSETSTECARKTVFSHSDSVNSLFAGSDGKLLASGSSDNTVKLWSMTDYSLVKTLTGHTGSVNSVAISSDCKILASGSSDSTVKLWDLTNFTLLATLTGHTGQVKTVAVSPDRTLVVSGSDDKTVKLWSLADYSCTKTLTDHTYPVISVAISFDGSMLASADGRSTCIIWNLSDGTKISTKGFGGPSVFCSDGSLAVFNGENYSGISVLNLSNSSKRNIDSAVKGAISVSNDCTMIASGGKGLSEFVELRAFNDGSLLFSLDHIYFDFKVNTLTFNKSGSLLFTVQNKDLIAWNTSTGKLVQTLIDPECTGGEFSSCTPSEESGERLVPMFYCSCDVACTCDSICSCDTVCTCNSEGGGGYYYPN